MTMIKLITIDRAGAGGVVAMPGRGVDWQDCYHTEESFITKKSLINDNVVILSLLIITFSHSRILLILLCHSKIIKILILV